VQGDRVGDALVEAGVQVVGVPAQLPDCCRRHTVQRQAVKGQDEVLTLDSLSQAPLRAVPIVFASRRWMVGR
jgi:hypothetical protein